MMSKCGLWFLVTAFIIDGFPDLCVGKKVTFWKDRSLRDLRETAIILHLQVLQAKFTRGALHWVFLSLSLEIHCYKSSKSTSGN